MKTYLFILLIVLSSAFVYAERQDFRDKQIHYMHYATNRSACESVFASVPDYLWESVGSISIYRDPQVLGDYTYYGWYTCGSRRIDLLTNCDDTTAYWLAHELVHKQVEDETGSCGLALQHGELFHYWMDRIWLSDWGFTWEI